MILLRLTHILGDFTRKGRRLLLLYSCVLRNYCINIKNYSDLLAKYEKVNNALCKLNGGGP